MIVFECAYVINALAALILGLGGIHQKRTNGKKEVRGACVCGYWRGSLPFCPTYQAGMLRVRRVRGRRLRRSRRTFLKISLQWRFNLGRLRTAWPSINQPVLRPLSMWRPHCARACIDDITTRHEAVVSQICSSLRACCCLIAPCTPHIYHILRYLLMSSQKAMFGRKIECKWPKQSILTALASGSHHLKHQVFRPSFGRRCLQMNDLRHHSNWRHHSDYLAPPLRAAYGTVCGGFRS